MYAKTNAFESNMYSARLASSAYRQVGLQTGVSGASPHELITLLFDGALESIVQARGHLADKRIAQKCSAITKAVRIVGEGLKAALDIEAGGELARRLFTLYEYIGTRLTYANWKNDDAALQECINLLTTLKEAWVAIDPRNAQTNGQTLRVLS